MSSRSRFARSMRVWRQDVGIMTSESSRFPDFSGFPQFSFAVFQVTICFITSYPFAPQIRPETGDAFSPSTIRLTNFGHGVAFYAPQINAGDCGLADVVPRGQGVSFDRRGRNIQCCCACPVSRARWQRRHRPHRPRPWSPWAGGRHVLQRR